MEAEHLRLPLHDEEAVVRDNPEPEDAIASLPGVE
jgi:hypothetical protein